MIEQLKVNYQKIPESVRLFLTKALLLAAAWNLVYILLLSKYLDKYLTIHVGQSTAAVLNRYSGIQGFSAVYGNYSKISRDGLLVNQPGSQILLNQDIVMNIANSCNALQLMVLYIGFIICIPAKLVRKLYYIPIGVVCIDIANITRTSILALLKVKYAVYFDFAHHYIFTMVVYSAIILMWLLFTRKSRLRYALV